MCLLDKHTQRCIINSGCSSYTSKWHWCFSLKWSIIHFWKFFQRMASKQTAICKISRRRILKRMLSWGEQLTIECSAILEVIYSFFSLYSLRKSIQSCTNPGSAFGFDTDSREPLILHELHLAFLELFLWLVFFALLSAALFIQVPLSLLPKQHWSVSEEGPPEMKILQNFVKSFYWR